MLKKKPQFIVSYQCYSCNQQCSYTDTQKAKCRYCEEWVNMIETDRQPIIVLAAETQPKTSIPGISSSFSSEKESAYSFN